MKFAGQIISGLVIVLLTSISAWADVAVSGNPYESVVERNIFGLVAIPTNPPADTKPPDPPAKITPNGIMSLFGELQVLFKVSVPPKPGQPPHDQSYTMSVGERSDDIEVTKIDGQAGVITFNNHGVIQELPLTKAVASSAPQPAQPATPAPGFRPPGMNNFRGRQNPNANQSFGGNNSNPAAHAYGNNGSTLGYGSAPPTGGNNNTQSQDNLSPEAAVVMMEAQRAQWQQEGNPAAAIIPPTPITKELNGESNGGGSPAIGSPPVP